MDLDAFMTGIEAAIDGDVTLTAIVGTRRTFARAPDDTDWPYLVYHVISEVPDYRCDDKDTFSLRIQFSFFSNAAPEAPTEPNSASDAILGAFQKQDIAVAGYNSRSPFMLLDSRLLTEENAWHLMMDFRVHYQES